MKLKPKDFIDWFSENIGHGYGTGEAYTIPALLGFLDVTPEEGNYDYEEIEKRIGGASTWFLMDIFCKTHFIGYGTSPRYGWLEKKGKLLKEFLKGKSVDEVYDLVMVDSTYTHCYPNACNCGPNGYEKGKVCDNPLFKTS